MFLRKPREEAVLQTCAHKPPTGYLNEAMGLRLFRELATGLTILLSIAGAFLVSIPHGGANLVEPWNLLAGAVLLSLALTMAYFLWRDRGTES